MPRADTLDAGFAQAVAAWVRAGGTLVVTDPDAFGRTPAGASLAPVRDELIGAPLGPRRPGTVLQVDPGALAAGVPDDLLTVPLGGARRARASPPCRPARAWSRASSTARRRPSCGPSGRAACWPSPPIPWRRARSTSPWTSRAWLADIHRWAGGSTVDPTWAYRLPGDPDPARLPWEGSIPPAAARAGL